jgi:Tfp pilus assembly protein PilV
MKRGEEGFTLVEAMVSVGLLAFSAMGFMATVVVALNVVSKVRVDDSMDVIAHNALTDLYAVTAYDAPAIAALSGRTQTYTVTQQTGTAPGGAVSYKVNVRVYAQPAGEIDATVQVSDTLGHASAMHGILAQAAPAPGSLYTPTYATPLLKP